LSVISSVVGSTNKCRPRTLTISVSIFLVFPHPGGPTSTSTRINTRLEIDGRESAGTSYCSDERAG
jgi:hypothetical protein